MIDLHNRENSLWNVLLRRKMTLKISQNDGFFFTLFIKIKNFVNEILKKKIKDAVQDKKNLKMQKKNHLFNMERPVVR